MSLLSSSSFVADDSLRPVDQREVGIGDNGVFLMSLAAVDGFFVIAFARLDGGFLLGECLGDNLRGGLLLLRPPAASAATHPPQRTFNLSKVYLTL